MSRLYCVLNKKDCKEMGIQYHPSIRIILAEHNSGHYTITRYTSPLGKAFIVCASPFILLFYIGRGIVESVKECFCAIHDTFEMKDRRDFWGEDNNYIHYLKNRY